MLCLEFISTSTSAQTPATGTPSDYHRAVELYKKGDYDGAIKILEKVVQKDGDADAWYFLGRAYYDSGFLWRAGDAFERVLRDRPNAADVRAKLSYALILGNETERAIANAHQAIALGDQSAEPYYAIAEARLRAGNYAEAVDQANHALKIKSGFAQALVTKYMALYRLGQYPEAIACLEDLLRHNPNDLDASVWRDQLESVRSLEQRKAAETGALTQASQERIFSGREVTTKARVLEKAEPTYTEAARHAGVTGTIILRATFSSKGEVTNIIVRQALSYGLTGKAVAAAREMRFVPATKDGKPVSMWMELQYNFNLY